VNDQQPESKFVIDGGDYPIPTLDTFDMDEAQLLYDLARMSVEDFAIADGDEEGEAELEQKIRNPGFIRTLMQVAYQRGNPGISAAKAKQVIGHANLIEAYDNWLEGLADASPPEQTRSKPEPPDEQSRPSSSNESSGGDSTNGSAQPDESPVATGISRSDTSSPQSVPTT